MPKARKRKQGGGCGCKSQKGGGRGRGKRKSQQGGGQVGDYIYENRYKLAAGIGAGAWLGLGIAGNMMSPTTRVYSDPYGNTLLPF